eukprot:scaffold699_cov95-Cylindrotheca_fusiformis.AAC.2
MKEYLGHTSMMKDSITTTPTLQAMNAPMPSNNTPTTTVVPTKWDLPVHSLPYDDDDEEDEGESLWSGTDEPSFFFQQLEEEEGEKQQKRVQSLPLPTSSPSPFRPMRCEEKELSPTLQFSRTYSLMEGEVKVDRGDMSVASSLSWQRTISFEDSDYFDRGAHKNNIPSTSLLARLQEAAQQTWKKDAWGCAATGFADEDDDDDDDYEPSPFTYLDENGNQQEVPILPKKTTKLRHCAVEESKSVGGDVLQSDEKSWTFLGSLSHQLSSHQRPDEEIVFHEEEKEKEQEGTSIHVTVAVGAKTLLENFQRNAGSNVQSVRLADSFAEEDPSILPSESPDAANTASDKDVLPKPTSSPQEATTKRPGVFLSISEHIATLGVTACSVGQDPDTVSDQVEPVDMTKVPSILEQGMERTVHHTFILEDAKSSPSSDIQDSNDLLLSSSSSSSLPPPRLRLEEEEVEPSKSGRWAKFEVAFPQTKYNQYHSEQHNDTKSIVTATTADDSKSTAVAAAVPAATRRPIYQEEECDRDYGDRGYVATGRIFREECRSDYDDHGYAAARQPIYPEEEESSSIGYDDDHGYEVAFSSFSSMSLLYVDPVNVSGKTTQLLCVNSSSRDSFEDELPSLMDQDDEWKFLEPPAAPMTSPMGKAKQRLSKRMLRLRRKFSRRRIEV